MVKDRDWVCAGNMAGGGERAEAGSGQALGLWPAAARSC